jgi:hypothetical protein
MSANGDGHLSYSDYSFSAFHYDDGGRLLAGFKGDAGDCVTRAIAIAAEIPYHEVYKAMNDLIKSSEEQVKHRGKPSARSGIPRVQYEKYLVSIGWEWIPTMTIGSGCQVHLKAAELPAGRIIARVSKHLCAVIDGVIHDTSDPSRGGTRCVYGYYREKQRI